MLKYVLLFCACCLAGCIGNPPRPTAVAMYDLGDVGGPGGGGAFPIATLEASAASWLDSTAQLYRLGYADAWQRHIYTESRWAAPPAELVGRLLHRRMISERPGRLGCRLVVALDEFEQRFDTAGTSRFVLDVRVQLLPLRGNQILGQRVFQIDRPTPSPDARGAVRAARVAVEALAGEMQQWLTEFSSVGTQPDGNVCTNFQ